MSNFLGLIQAILTTGLFVEGVAAVVLKKQIEDLVKKYQSEFDCINKLSTHIEKLSTSRPLITQLRTSIAFSTYQWTAITSDLNNRKDFFDTLKDKMDKISMPSEQNKWSDYAKAFFEGLGAIGFWVLYCKKTNIGELAQKLSKWCTKNRVQPAPKQAQISQNPLNQNKLQIQLQNRNININQLKNNIEQLKSPQKINPSEKPTKIQSKTWDRIKTGIHVVVIVGLCVGFVAGVVDIVELVKEKRKLDQVFGANGSFKEVQEGVIQLMKFVSISLYQISNTSKYVLNDLSRLFLTKSIITPKYFDMLYQNAAKLRPFEFGVTDDYITSSEKFMSAVVDQGNSKDSNPDKLYTIQKLYDNFMTTQKPDSIMSNIAQVISQTIGNFSLASGQIEDYNQKYYRFLNFTCNLIAQRNVKITGDITDDKRKSTDVEYLKLVLEKFNKIFQDQAIDLLALSLQDKKMLYHLIGLFSNNFYYDDTSGKTLFGFEFSKIAELKTYGDIFKDYEENPPKYIKISYTDAALETKVQNEYIAQVKKLSGDNNSTVHPLFRYIRYVEAENSEEKDQQKKKYIKNIEGMKYTLNNDTAIKTIQRDFSNHNYNLIA